MKAKPLAAIVTLLISVVLAVVVLFFLLVAMNGYSESDAEPALAVYVVLALVSAVLAAVAAAWFVGLLARRKFVPASSAVIAVPIATALGAALIVVSALMGLVIAEYMRVSY